MSDSITERDLRHPKFRDIDDLSHYEKDGFGCIVRKDRFQVALSNLSVTLYGTSRRVWFVETIKADLSAIIRHVKDFEFSGEDLKSKLESLEEEMNFGTSAEDDSILDVWPELKNDKRVQVEVLLQDGSLLRNAWLELIEDKSDNERPPVWSVVCHWRNMSLTSEVLAMRTQRDKAVLCLLQDDDAFVDASTMDKESFREQNQRALQTDPSGVNPPESIL